MTVCRSDERPFDAVKYLGVVVRAVDSIDPAASFGLHSGFLYKLDGQPPRLNHLAWHFDLRDEPAVDDKYLWADTGLDERNSQVIAAWLTDRRERPSMIPYGLDAQGACFDKETQDFLPPPLGKGLTCATYMQAVLKHLGFILLDEATWPADRAEDASWQVAVVDVLRKTGAAEDHINALASDVGSKRLRPAEVVGAATVTSGSWPVAFDRASAIAQTIILDVQAAMNAAEQSGPPAKEGLPANESVPLNTGVGDQTGSK
jgi:hypothetical protein